MGYDGGLLSAGGSVEPLMCVVQELCNLYHGGACFGRQVSGQVGSSRVESGQVGISRVKAGDNFFLAIGVVTLLHRFFPFPASIPGSGSLSTTRIHDFRRRRTQVDSLAAGGQGVVCGRLRSVYAGQKRAVFLSMDFCVWLRARSLAVSVGLWVDRLYAVYSLARVLPRLQIPSQWASSVHDDDTLSAVPIRISVQGYYITVSDAIALDTVYW